jgi:hypothetical protein
LSKIPLISHVTRIRSKFASEFLKITETDMLFKVPFKETKAEVSGDENRRQQHRRYRRAAYIYILVEHQSTDDYIMGMRFIGYISEVIASDLSKTRGASLPVVLPMLLEQCRRPWKTLPRFGPELFGLNAAAAAEFRRYIPTFEFEVLDLATLPHSEIRGSLLGRCLLRVLKAEREGGGALLDDEVWNESELVEIRYQHPSRFVRFMNYIFTNPAVGKDAALANLGALQSPELRSTGAAP